MTRLETLPRHKGVVFVLLSVLAVAAVTKPLFADFATPFVEINNQIGDRSRAHGSDPYPLCKWCVPGDLGQCGPKRRVHLDLEGRVGV